MHLRIHSRSTAPLPFVLGRCSKPSFTPCKFRFLHSVRTQLTAARNDLEQVLKSSMHTYLEEIIVNESQAAIFSILFLPFSLAR